MGFPAKRDASDSIPVGVVCRLSIDTLSTVDLQLGNPTSPAFTTIRVPSGSAILAVSTRKSDSLPRYRNERSHGIAASAGKGAK